MTPETENLYHLWNEDALTALAKIDSSSIGAVITDPPYPGVYRLYGKTKTRLGEEEWNDLMDKVVEEVKRVLTPTGSAVFILQPVGNRLGEMSLWLPKFLVRTAEKWNWIKNHWWHNPVGCPGIWSSPRKVDRF